jgi:methyl-accepting chemotaxis protein
MFGRQLLRRLDAHIEQGNAHMERGNAHMERGNELMQRLDKTMAEIRHEVELTREEVRLSRESRTDLREFIREMLTRFDRAAQAQAAGLQEVYDESRAQRQALLRLIDRMDRLEPGGSAASG